MRMDLRRLLCVTVLALLPLGCVSVGMLPLGKEPKPCTFKGGTVQVFRGRPEGRSYTELAIVTAHVRWWWSSPSWEDMLGDLCQEAADVGANAIIDLSVGDLTDSWTLGPVGLGGNVRHLTGVAVRLE
jgi:hypothetical protein